MTLPILAVGIAVFLAVYLYGTHRAAKLPRHQARAIARLHEWQDPDSETAPPDSHIDTLKGAALAMGPWLTKNGTVQSNRLKERLGLAGYRHDNAVFFFTALQLGLFLASALLGGLLGILIGLGWQKILLMACCSGAAAPLLLSLLLSFRATSRQRQIRRAFPDALDILVLSIEGGASMNAALAWAAEELPVLHPLLGSEMQIVQRETQLGLAPSEAFQSLANRCGLEEARDLSAALLQSERYGASLAKSLRSFADTARQDREMWTEEVAQKASVKIIFPMLLCIFPAIFIVLLGPAAAQMTKLFAR